MTKISKIRSAVVTVLVTIAIGLPTIAAVANAPSKSTISFEQSHKTVVLPEIEISSPVRYNNPKPIAKKNIKNVVVRHATTNHINQVVYTELEQGGRPGADFVRRF